jgi:tRNA 2-selenouridine synthase
MKRHPAIQAADAETFAHLEQFSCVIDVRSPGEFADDHLPGAINLPVLDDLQRETVGTIYKQQSPFVAKKIGAAMVSENIARHLRESLLDHPREWRPLIYCWRGGQRSGAMTTVLRQIGWDALQLEGGYKAYRRHVVEMLDTVPGRFKYRIIKGATGSAKTRVLHAIRRLGAQTIDLEALAEHKGSVLGLVPDTRQKHSNPACWRNSCNSTPTVRSSSKRKAGRSAASTYPSA